MESVHGSFYYFCGGKMGSKQEQSADRVSILCKTYNSSVTCTYSVEYFAFEVVGGAVG